MIAINFHWVPQYFLIFLRISTFFFMIPLFKKPWVLSGYTIIFAISISMVLLSIAVDPQKTIDLFSASGVLLILKQLFLAMMMGLVFQWMFQLLLFTGQIFSYQSGLSFASLFDPTYGESVPLLGHLYTFLSFLIFFSIEGHLVLIALLKKSFELYPLDYSFYGINAWLFLKNYSGYVFSSAIVLALPVIISLLGINLVMAFMTKASAQLNVFVLSASLLLIATFVLLFFVFDTMSIQIQHFFLKTFEASQTLLRQLHG